MRIFFDTEFMMHENGIPELLAIGMVKANGEAYYAENGDADLTRADEWVQQNVIPHFTGPIRALPQLAREVRHFMGGDPELWAYYNTYDHLLLLQLLGGWRGTPEPARVCHDLATLLLINGQHENRMPKHVGTQHFALTDAEWVRTAFMHMTEAAPEPI